MEKYRNNEEMHNINELKQSFEDLIMTAQEYSEHNHETPYRIELEAGNKELVYFGVGHSSDPKDPIFNKIKEDIENLKPELVMVEGMPQVNTMDLKSDKEKIIAMDINRLIKKHGEPVFAVKTAVENDIRVNSPEPREQDINQFRLDHGISKEAIFMQEMSTAVYQYMRKQEKPSLEEYVGVFLKQFEESWEWKNFDFSFEHYKSLFEQVTGKPFIGETMEEVKEMSDPILWEAEKASEVQKSAELSSIYRDRYMINQIQAALEKYDKVYVVFGASHAVMQEPALRKLMEYEAAKS